MEINIQGNYKLRFDPSEVRISIDGDRIDVGARMPSSSEFKCDDPHILSCTNELLNASVGTDKTLKQEDIGYRFESRDRYGGETYTDFVEFLEDDVIYQDNKTGEVSSGRLLKLKYGAVKKD